jgi:integrase
MYYWRRRLTKSLAAFQDRQHVLMSLGTREPHIARALGALLDTAFGEIAMSHNGFLSATQLDAMLRAIVAAHSEKLDRIAAVAKAERFFDVDAAARMDLKIGWCYRLLGAQGPDAMVRSADRAAMKEAGLDDADMAFVDEHLHRLQVNRLVPTPRPRLEALVAGQGGLPTEMNLASAQQVYYRGLSLALLDWRRRYAGAEPDAAAIVSHALRLDRTGATGQQVPAYVAPAPAAAAPASAAPAQPCSLEEHPVWLAGQKLIAHNKKHKIWRENGERQAEQNYRLLVLLLIELKIYSIEGLEQSTFAKYKLLLSQVAKSYGKSEQDKTRSLQELRDIGASKPAAERGLAGGTINRHTNKLGALIGAMRTDGLMTRDINLDGFRVKKTTRNRDLTQSAKPQRIEALFNLPCMTGCAGAEAQFEPGSLIFHGSNYFVPQLLYYLGGRREEFCALRVEEVVLDAFNPHILVEDNAYRDLKTPASKRALPIPPETMRLGFGEYKLEIEKLGYDLLFPELRWKGSTAPLGDRFYKNFTAGLELIRAAVPSGGNDGNGKNDDKQDFTFRQLRKAFGATLKKKGVNTETRSDLLGHVGDSVNSETYADATELMRMREIMEKIPNVTSHLQPRPINLLPWVRDKLPPPDARGRERAARLKRR